ncbi:M23 family metallopeptidase [Larsenimonas rhizosphaerae]|uniref:M23 family metallopeptidase n=1 Tax=Larsenimonas rhizosphaerae TaxID=2944682 RepID=A0AA41ZFX1_9GAMM|nr:M23 family metallopeptidase [Larsenimonas rhizosphaerae]MCX2524037.1 M23 family metallopeptidase [Larsenimonas rhizosphaerae]
MMSTAHYGAVGAFSRFFSWWAALLAMAFGLAAPSLQAAENDIILPAHVQQGAMVIGRVPVGSQVRYDGHVLNVSDYGTIVFGIGRDETRPRTIEVTLPSGVRQQASVTVTPRDWPIERVNGVPSSTVSPPPDIAARIGREQAQVSAARTRNDNRTGFAQHFIWPVEGRISGRFGRQRIYNGTPGSAHSGMDIAAPTGTPVRAPASGVITFADPDLYLTGGTVLLDHGFGISSNFLHLSALDVSVGDTVTQGQVIGRVGATGRATGPHLHWGMSWFSTRIDPLLVVKREE